MSRASRLIDLIEALRRRRHPVAAQVLAGELGVSLRTIYRDIATLQAQGADIAGEPGLGYVLRPGFLLPPLMFSEDELSALALGMQWVAKRTDPRLSEAAGRALDRIRSVLPADLQQAVDESGFIVGPGTALATERVDLTALREAIRAERKLAIVYRDLSGQETRRIVWPIALAFFDRVRVLAAFCELRGDFRHFRVDRIATLERLPDRLPKSRRALTRIWKASLKPKHADRN